MTTFSKMIEKMSTEQIEMIINEYADYEPLLFQ